MAITEKLLESVATVLMRKAATDLPKEVVKALEDAAECEWSAPSLCTNQ